MVPPDVLDALAEGDRRPAFEWLTRHLVVPGRLPKADLDELSRIERWNFEQDAEDEAASDPDATDEPPSAIDAPQKAEELVGRAVAATVGVLHATPLLVLYLRFECEQAWELSWWHEPIRETIRAVNVAWNACAHNALPADAAVMPAALTCLDILDHELLVESALATASLSRAAAEAQRTAETASRARRDAERAADAPGADAFTRRLLRSLRECGEREEAYYGAVAAAARAFAGGFSGAPDELDAAIAGLQKVEERRLIDEIDRSELRAHRAGLQALVAARKRPTLRVDDGRIVYLYPFGLRGSGRPCPPEDLVEELRRGAEDWKLAGLQVRRVQRDLPLNDIWHGNDPFRRQHGGAAAELPDLLGPDPDGGEPIPVSVELRLCALGNHYLRLEAPLDDVAPPALYAAVLRPSPEFGDLAELDLPITPDLDGAEQEWGGLAEFSEAVISDVVRELNAKLDAGIEHSGRPGQYHVLVAIRRASAHESDGAIRPLDRGEELEQALGVQPLWHPVRHGVSAIGEWLRYPLDPDLRVSNPAFTGDLVVRTANSTLLALFGSPDYMIGAVVEAAEFVATLDGLFATWQQELADYYKKIDGPLQDMLTEVDAEKTRRPGTEAPDDLTQAQTALQKLERAQLHLHQFVMASRRTLIFLTSPSLVTSPVMRVTLDRLMDAAGFDRLRAEFVGMVDEVLGDRLGTLVDTSVRRQQEIYDDLAEQQRMEEQKWEDARESRQRRRTEIVTAGIGAIGVAGIFQLLQTGIGQSMVWAEVFAVLTLLIGVAIGVYISSTLRAGDPRRPEGDRHGTRGAVRSRRADGPLP
jgi:hypothetical protein